MENLKSIKQCLVSQVQNQLGDIKKANTKELSEVIDMIKDMEEAMYYCSIIQAMEESKERHTESKMYTPYMEYAPYMMRDDKWRDDHLWDKKERYYDDNSHSNMSRKMYIEGKHNHKEDTSTSMKELEYYVRDLSDDITDMIKESTQEERQMLSTKLSQLAARIK